MFIWIKDNIIKIPYYETVIPLWIVSFISFFGAWFERIDFADIILLLTFGAILWYSFETRQLKNATRTNNELQQTPLFVLLYNGNSLTLKNAGKGIAYNIRINSIILDKKTFEFELLKPWHYCGIGDSRELHLTISQNNGSQRILEQSLKQFLHTLFIKGVDAKFVIRYSSAIKKDDYQEFILRIKDYGMDIIEIFPN